MNQNWITVTKKKIRCRRILLRDHREQISIKHLKWNIYLVHLYNIYITKKIRGRASRRLAQMLPILEVKSIVPYHYQSLKNCSESSTKNILLKMLGSVNDPPKHNPPILIRTPWPLTLHPAMHNALKMEKITPKTNEETN